MNAIFYNKKFSAIEPRLFFVENQIIYHILSTEYHSLQKMSAIYGIKEVDFIKSSTIKSEPHD